MSTRNSIKIVRGALDVVTIDGKEHLILRGVIDPESLPLLQVDDYQREVLQRKRVEAFERALTKGEVPDIDLGMRGSRIREHEDGTHFLQDPVYIVDGLQRVTAAKNLLAGNTGQSPRLGATIHLDTDYQWEKERFKTLNSERIRVNANILLRNTSDTNQAVALLRSLTDKDRGFVLYGRVSWSQRMTRNDRVTASTLVKVITRAHSHIGPGRSSDVLALAEGLETISQRVGKNILRDNIREFFEVIDECWGIANVTYTDCNTQLHLGFMATLAEVLSGHTTFWEGNRLTIPKHIRKKLSKFNVQDPYVKELSSSNSSGLTILGTMMVKHINSGRRTRKLMARVPADMEPTVDEVSDDSDENE